MLYLTAPIMPESAQLNEPQDDAQQAPQQPLQRDGADNDQSPDLQGPALAQAMLWAERALREPYIPPPPDTTTQIAHADHQANGATAPVAETHPEERQTPRETAEMPTDGHGTPTGALPPPTQAQALEQTPVVETFPAWTAAFLAAYSIGGQLYRAADAAGINRGTAWLLECRSRRFKELCAEAKQRSISNGLQEVYNRGVIGWSKPVFFGGEVVGWETCKSDSLLLAYVKAHDPAFRDKVDLSHTSPKDAPVRVESTVEIKDALAPYRDATRMLLESIVAERALTSPQPDPAPALEYHPQNLSSEKSISTNGDARPCPRCDGPGINPFCPVCHGAGTLPTAP